MHKFVFQACVDDVLPVSEPLTLPSGEVVDSVFVVVGAEASAVSHALESTNATIILNPDWANGLSTSIRRGIAAVPIDVKCGQRRGMCNMSIPFSLSWPLAGYASGTLVGWLQ